MVPSSVLAGAAASANVVGVAAGVPFSLLLLLLLLPLLLLILVPIVLIRVVQAVLEVTIVCVTVGEIVRERPARPSGRFGL